jgi:hypothetical protein
MRVYRISHPRDYPYGRDHQCICECVVIIFLSEVPEVDRRAPRRTRTSSDDHRLIYAWLSDTWLTDRDHHLYRLTILLSTDVRAPGSRTLHPLSRRTLLLTSRTYQCPLRQELR